MRAAIAWLIRRAVRLLRDPIVVDLIIDEARELASRTSNTVDDKVVKAVDLLLRRHLPGAGDAR